MSFGLCLGSALAVAVCTEMTVAAPPNDPDFLLQWGLSNTAQDVDGKVGVAGADVDAPGAWDIHAGGSPVIVAIISAGVSAHPQFADRLLEGTVTTPNGDPYSTLDTNGQGTHLAGIIAASMNDGVGIAGLNPHARILPVRVLQNTSGSTGSVAAGIVWAADQGAGVILVPLQFYHDDPALEAAVDYAWSKGAVLVATAGDSAFPDVAYPAAYDNCIAVSGTTSDDVLPTYANFGPAIEIAAPTENIWSTQRNGDYGFEGGSTCAPAAAFVAGAASLIRSYGPQLSAAQVRQILRDSSDDLGPVGRDDQFGYGRLNVARALQMTATLPIRFELLDGLPQVLPTNRASSAIIRIAAGTHVVLPQTTSLIYRILPGGIQPAIPLRWLGGDSYEVPFPALPCTVSMEYYLAATASNLTTVFEPRSAPAGIKTASVASSVILFHDDLESDQGWTATALGEDTDGHWVRVDPVGTLSGNTRVQPEYDVTTDAQSHCFVTGQHFGSSTKMISSNDVDAGPLVLTSPVIELTTQDAEISFSAWMFNNADPPEAMLVEVSTDGGATWSAGPSIGPTNGWQQQAFLLSQYAPPTGYRLAMRFSITETIPALTEAAIDGLTVTGIACHVPGDLDNNGKIDKGDWRGFAGCIRGPLLPALPACGPANVARSSTVDLHDTAVFQRMLK